MALDSSKIKNRIYAAHAPVSSLLADLEALKQADRHAEQKQRTAGTLAVLAALGAVAGIVGSILAEQPLVALVGLAVMGPVFLYGITSYIHHKGLNFENRRYHLLASILPMLGRDTAAESPLDVKLDLRLPTDHSKFQRKGKAGTWNVKYYVDPWLQLRGRLLDGTSYSLTVTERFQARSKWKRSASGKTKHKSKTKSQTVAALRLKPKSKRYPQLDRLAADAQQAIQLPGFVQLQELSVQDGSLVLKSQASSWSAGPSERPGRTTADHLRADGSQWIAMKFLSLYQVLNLARRVGKEVS